MDIWKIVELPGYPVLYRVRLNDEQIAAALPYDEARRFVWTRCSDDDQVIEIYLTRSVTITGAELGKQLALDAAWDAGRI